MLLSISTLLGVGLYMLTGAARLDPVAGFIISAFAMWEGKDALGGRTCRRRRWRRLNGMTPGPEWRWVRLRPGRCMENAAGSGGVGVPALVLAALVRPGFRRPFWTR